MIWHPSHRLFAQSSAGRRGTCDAYPLEVASNALLRALKFHSDLGRKAEFMRGKRLELDEEGKRG